MKNISGRLLCDNLSLRTLATPPNQGRSFRWYAPTQSGYKLLFSRDRHFQIGEKCKVCISGAEGRRDSGTSLACSAVRVMPDGSRFQVLRR